MKHLILLAAATLPTAAQAVTYDVVADFLTNPSGVWSYGISDGPNGFVAFTGGVQEDCFGTDGFSCRSGGGYLGTAQNTTSADINPFGTVSIPNDVVWMHPQNGTGVTDVTVRFTAAFASTYSLKGYFSRLSNNANANSGNGVKVAIYKGTGSIFTGDLSNLPLSNGASAGFDQTIGLAAGESLSFVVNNNGGDYLFDSTGLSLSVAAVPEPATWGMMLLGFGLVGMAVRGRRSRALA